MNPLLVVFCIFLPALLVSHCNDISSLKRRVSELETRVDRCECR